MRIVQAVTCITGPSEALHRVSRNSGTRSDSRQLQPKILRALQEKEFERLGGTRTIPVDVRLVAATNRNLAKMVEEREFRSDLYYRLKVFPLEVPPLRERLEDIPLLVKYFVSQHARRMNRHIETIPPEVMQALVRWRWPGNVRELENFIERAVILSPGPGLKVPLAELELTAEPTTSTSANLHDAERNHILRVLREAKGMISGPTGAAKRLGLKRTTLNSKLKKLGIKRRTTFSRLDEISSRQAFVIRRGDFQAALGFSCNPSVFLHL